MLAGVSASSPERAFEANPYHSLLRTHISAEKVEVVSLHLQVRDRSERPAAVCACAVCVSSPATPWSPPGGGGCSTCLVRGGRMR